MAVGFVIGVSCYSNSISYYYKIIYFNTIELDVFINAADIVPILSIVATLVSEGRLINVIGITPCRIVYLLRNKPMTLSTWIRNRASCHVFSTSAIESCFLPLVKAGISNWAPRIAKSSEILKPWSAITTSPYDM